MDRGIAFELRPRLVRGLDYYTRTTFEITHGALGAQNSVLGGGRYDGLAETLGSKVRAPGIGFSIGEDRLVMSVEETGASVEQIAAKPLVPESGRSAETRPARQSTVTHEQVARRLSELGVNMGRVLLGGAALQFTADRLAVPAGQRILELVLQSPPGTYSHYLTPTAADRNQS